MRSLGRQSSVVRIHKPIPVTPRWDRDCFCQACGHTMKLVCIKKRCICCTYMANLKWEQRKPKRHAEVEQVKPSTACTCPICAHGEKVACLKLKCICCVRVLIYRDEHT